VYIRRVEKIDGELRAAKIAAPDDVKDPVKAPME
jgi:hypothetical protein